MTEKEVTALMRTSAMCFRIYKDDVVEDTSLDWLQYTCQRWLHEECIDYDIGHDPHGNDLLSPFCCV